MGGMISTTMAIGWHLLLCAKYPDTIQAQQEIDKAVGPHQSSTWQEK